MSLFSGLPEPETFAALQPLAERMRPRTLDEFIGQEKLLGPGKPLRVQIESDNLSSMLFWGPPGCGKTTLARLIARLTKSEFIPFSAVTSGIKEIKEVMAEAEKKSRGGLRTIVFVDEVHRFNKSQQDAFLPHVEAGHILFIGATTENPSFEVISPLLSRTKVYVLDAHTAYNTLELAVKSSPAEAASSAAKAGPIMITSDLLEALLQRKMLRYDKSGEEHFNLISALHKSVRNSDPDAALYWLARMLESG